MPDIGWRNVECFSKIPFPYLLFIMRFCVPGATVGEQPWMGHGREPLPYLYLDSALSSSLSSLLLFSSDSICAGIPSPFRGDSVAIAWSLPAIFPCCADSNAGNILCRQLVSGLHFPDIASAFRDAPGSIFENRRASFHDA